MSRAALVQAPIGRRQIKPAREASMQGSLVAGRCGSGARRGAAVTSAPQKRTQPSVATL